MKRKVFAEISGELLDPAKSNFRGVVQVIDDDGAVTAEEELENSVASNVASATGDENSFRHNHTRFWRRRVIKRRERELRTEFWKITEEERFGNGAQIYTTWSSKNRINYQNSEIKGFCFFFFVSLFKGSFLLLIGKKKKKKWDWEG